MKKIVLIVLCLYITISVTAQSNNNRHSKEAELAIDYSKPVHSLGLTINTNFSFSHTYNCLGGESILPLTKPRIIPEFSVQYNCIISNHFGFSLEIPFGLFMHNFTLDLTPYGGDSYYREIGSPYIGFIPKLSYYRDLGKRVGITIDVGVKFMPFCYDSEHWEPDPTEIVNIDIVDGQVVENDPFDADVPQKNYYIPDATAAFLFNFHGKNIHHNFILGIVGNLSFVNRMNINYTFIENSFLSVSAQTKGTIGWNSSSIGLTIGYRFMGLRP